jgi:DNA-binding transcriptional LysR family regulator
LRLTAPRAVVPLLLEPLLVSFHQAYPDVTVEIVASEELVDLAVGGFDAGIRLGQFIAADMIAIRLTPSFPLTVVGSPAYLRRAKAPERIEDLGDHACLRWRRSGGALAPWTFTQGNKRVEAVVSGPFIANDFPTLLGAALEGLGLAQLPRPVVSSAIKAGRLVPVLEPFAPAAPGVFLYYPSRQQMMPKLRAFIDHVKERQMAARDSNRPKGPRGRSRR